jgi:hypothetical protein
MTLPPTSRRLARLLAASLAATALAAPPAIAMPDAGPGSGSEPVSAESPVVVRAIDEGFDWGSAAIGAGGAGALIVLVSLGGFGYAGRDRIRVAR